MRTAQFEAALSTLVYSHEHVQVALLGTCNDLLQNKASGLADEKAVASFYDKTTATFCAPVAPTLALRLSDWDSLLMWTQSVNVSGYTIAGGFLKVVSPTNLANKETQLKEAMGEEMLKLFQDVGDK